MRWGAVLLAVLAALLLAASAGCAAGGHVSYSGYSGKAVVSGDGRTITIGLYQGYGCPAKITPVARQTSAHVALYLEYDTPSNPPPCPPAQGTLVPWHNLKLATSLGHRSLVDGATGKAIAWISARLVLRPTVLPPGYQFSRLVPYGEYNLSGPAGCVQIYLSEHSGLTIGQSAGGTDLETVPGHWTRIRVRGHPGLAGRGVITWRENGLNDYIVATLSTQQLIMIADGAQTYGLAPLPNPGR